MNEKLKFCEGFDFETNDMYVILANTYNGNCLKLTNECFYILKCSIDENLTCAQILDQFEDDSDKEYFKKILNFCMLNDIIVPDGYVERTSLDVVITDRCNLGCRHCYMSSVDVTSDDKLSFNDWKDIFDSFAEYADEINISGGEPLMREDIYDIIDYIRGISDAHITLSTNGTMITEYNVKKLCDTFNSFSISFDGVDEESCSKIRGKYVFEKAVKAVKLIHMYDPEKKISASMVLSKDNSSLCQRFKELCNELNMTPLLRHLSPLGRASDNPQLFSDKVAILKANLDDSNKQYLCDNIDECMACRGGLRRIAINYDGKLYPCMPLINKEFCMGEAKDVKSLEEYLNRGDNLKSSGLNNFFNNYKMNTSNKCRDCSVKLHCCTCQLNAYLMKKSDMFEMICAQNKQKLSVIWR